MRASKQAKFSILKQPVSLLLIFLAFFSFNSSHTPQCVSFLQSLASHSEFFNHSETDHVDGISCHTVTSSVGSEVGHNGHGCVLDCSKQHQPALVPINTSYEAAEKQSKLQPSTQWLFKLLSFNRFFDVVQKLSIVPVLETTSSTFSLLSLSRSVRSVVILV